MYATLFLIKEVAAIKTTLELLREDRDMSQRQVANLLGVSQQQYSQYEGGVNELPLRHFAKLAELAELFDVSADYLLGRTTRAEGQSFKNIQLTKDCSCSQLMDSVLGLNDKGRDAVVEYVELQRLKEGLPKL